MRELLSGYASEIDAVEEQTWYQLLQRFDDANIFQTWSYADVRYGRQNTSHFLLRKKGDVVAVAQARIIKLPLVDVGVAYIRWGPLWHLQNSETSLETFRQAIRALRNEYACRRGLVLRLFPILFDDDAPCFLSILREEGLSLSGAEQRSRTMLMDLSRELRDLREGLRPHWRRELKIAERNGLEIVEGVEDELFETFIKIYREMVSRKRFREGNDINQFRVIQRLLPEKFKMKIMLCRSNGKVCAGLVCSAIGRTAIYLFGATSNDGMRSRGSYLLHWNLIERLRQNNVSRYDLHGIDPVRNPGTYKFKSDLAGKNGKDVYFLGRFDSSANFLSQFCVESAYTLRTTYRTLRRNMGTGHLLRPFWRKSDLLGDGPERF